MAEHDDTTSEEATSLANMTSGGGPFLLAMSSAAAIEKIGDEAMGVALRAPASADASALPVPIAEAPNGDLSASESWPQAAAVRKTLLLELVRWLDPQTMHGEILTHVAIGVPFFKANDYARFRKKFVLLDDDALMRVILLISETDNDNARGYRLAKSLVMAAEATTEWALDREIEVERQKDPQRFTVISTTLSESGRSAALIDRRYILLRDLRKGSRRPRAELRGANVDGRRLPTAWAPMIPHPDLRARIGHDIIAPLSILGQFDPEFLENLLAVPWIVTSLLDAVLVLVMKTANPQYEFLQHLYPVFQAVGLRTERPNGRGPRLSTTKRTDDPYAKMSRDQRREGRGPHVARVIIERGLMLSSDDPGRFAYSGGHRLIDRLRDELPPKVAPRARGRARPLTEKERLRAKEIAAELAERRAKAAKLRRQRRIAHRKWANERKRLARSRRAKLFAILSSRR